MSSASKSRSRSRSQRHRRRAQLLAGRYVPVGEAPWLRSDNRTWAQKFDDWMLSRLSERVAVVLFALACVILSIFAIATVSAFADLRAFDNAPTCDASTTTACLDDVSVVIVDVGRTNGKDGVYYVDVSGLSQTTTRIRLRNGSGVWDIARDGDDAMVELWNGVPISITADYVTSETADSPRESAVLAASFALVALAGTAMFALYWLRRRAFRRAGGKRWPEWRTLLEPTALIATIGFFVGTIAGSWAQSVVVTIAVGGAITLLAGALFARNSRRAPSKTR